MKTPIVEPNASTTTIPARQKLTAEQDSKYQALLSRVSEWKDSFHEQPLGENERRFLTRECLLRFLRAAKWNVNDSLARLDATLLWRRERHIDDLKPEGEMMDSIKTGRLVPFGYDNNGRPCLYYRILLDTPELQEIQLSHLCFLTEKTIDMMPPGVESITFVADLHGVSRSTTLTMAKMRAYIGAFQDHNPERLAMAVLPSSLPWWAWGIWKIVGMFLDPIVRDKVKFEGDFDHCISKDNLWAKYGGNLDFELDNDVYWTEFLDEAGRRREEYVKRWEAAGKRIGESEDYLRGGSDTPNRDTAETEPTVDISGTRKGGSTGTGLEVDDSDPGNGDATGTELEANKSDPGNEDPTGTESKVDVSHTGNEHTTRTESKIDVSGTQNKESTGTEPKVDTS